HTYPLYIHDATPNIHTFPTHRSSDLWVSRRHARERQYTPFPRPTIVRYNPVRYIPTRCSLEVPNMPRKLTDADIDDLIKRYQTRSEEHTSELQSREKLVCRLPLEKKK